jgi:hypothetical protein
VKTMRSLVTTIGTLALVACAAKQQTAGSAPKMEQQQIKNIWQFDLASCFPKTWALPEPATRESTIGFLVGQRPGVLECFVDPKNRGPEKITRVAVDTTVSETGVEHKVSGDNLTPAGISCVKGVLDKALGLKPQPKGVAPAVGHAEFVHTGGVTPTVNFGINEASDDVGTIRLAVQGWCECFTDWKDAVPYKLLAKLEVKKGAVPEGVDGGVAAPPTIDVNFDPGANPAADKVAACLKPKIASVHFDVRSADLKFPYPFVTINTSVTDDLPDEPDDVNFLQLDGARAQLAAEVAVAQGAQRDVADVWNKLVEKYNKTHSAALVPELKRRCAALLTADDAWAAAIQSQLTLEKHTVDLVAKLKEQNPNDTGWADTVTNAQKSADDLQTYLGKIKGARTGDAAGCPKEKY